MGSNNGIFSSGNGGACISDDCGLWDWRLKLNDTTLRDFTNLPSGGTTCSNTVKGHSITTTTYSFYSRAFEVLDQNGDNDGLCEISENCILAPNFGAYQGEGLPSDSTANICTLSGGTLKYYPTNGI
jgi:hypothetical protein